MTLIRANPGKIKMATAEEGTAGRYAGEMLIATAGIMGGRPLQRASRLFNAIVSIRRPRQWTVALIAELMKDVAAITARSRHSRGRRP